MEITNQNVLVAGDNYSSHVSNPQDVLKCGIDEAVAESVDRQSARIRGARRFVAELQLRNIVFPHLILWLTNKIRLPFRLLQELLAP